MAKTEVKPKAKTVGRKCSICESDKLTQINKTLADGGVSLRNIAKHWMGSEKHYQAVFRHAENCLKMQIGTVVLEKKSEQAFDFATELQKLYFKATKMVTALEKWLVDADDPDAFDIGPRDTEVLVTFLDYLNTNDQGSPTRSKAPLSELIERLENTSAVRVLGLASTAVDNRKLYLDAFKTLNDRLEQIAKFHGLWQKDKTNEADAELERIRALVTSWAKDNGTTIDQELQFVFSRYGQTLPKNVSQQLVSDLEN